jgi:hypothetical protein
MRNLFNFGAFYGAWFACVGGVGNGMPWLGPLAVTAIVLVHIKILSTSRHELRFVVAAAILGCFADAFLIQLGALAFTGTSATRALPPAWMVSLWLVFATTVNHSLAWLAGRYRLAALFGAIGGPLSYYAGIRLHAAVFPDPVFSLVAIAVVWTAAMPGLLWLNDRLREGLSAAPPRPLPSAYAPVVAVSTRNRQNGR